MDGCDGVVCCVFDWDMDSDPKLLLDFANRSVILYEMPRSERQLPITGLDPRSLILGL